METPHPISILLGLLGWIVIGWIFGVSISIMVLIVLAIGGLLILAYYTLSF